MRELQTWGSKPPRRRCEKTEQSSADVVIIWIIGIALGAAILAMR